MKLNIMENQFKQKITTQLEFLIKIKIKLELYQFPNIKLNKK